MTQEMYSIREAAEVLGVEAHALRFWEEELGLKINRNGQGRRIYSEEDMQSFRQIISWKEQGLQLKVIRLLLHPEEQEEGKQDGDFDAVGERRIIMYRPREASREETERAAWREEAEGATWRGEADMEPERVERITSLDQGKIPSGIERAEKSRRLQELLKQFIAESIRESNAELLQGIREGLMKELDYQFRLQEEREEEREKIRIEKEDEHFRQLDENLRSAMEKRGRKKKRGIFRSMS